MSNIEKNEEIIDEVVEQNDVPAAPSTMMIDLPTAINTVIARTESTNMIVAIINAVLGVLQNRDPAVFSPEDLAKIQEAVNAETAKTDALYAQIEAALSKPATNEDESEIASEASVN